ncbi:MAG: CotH kinase family protein [Bacteroidaceae bacterium]|nr:CotH kinase family protein [Bacteroidaceae bacterium]
MKKFFTTILLTTASLASFAQEWIDVTDNYVINPRFDNNDIKTGWEGTAYSANQPVENAEHYNKNYDTYQHMTGLLPGKYRVSVNAFYRMGSASNDYSLYDSKNYNSSQHAKLYTKSSAGETTIAIVPASSAALENSLGGKHAEVSSNSGWWWWSTTYYLPDNMEAAHYWFEAGYYSNSLECEVEEDGELTIGIRKSSKINNDWTCLDNWKLEFFGEVDGLSLPEEISMVPQETRLLTAKAVPYNVDYKNVKWMSSNNNVAKVDDNGQVTAVGTGFCFITAISKANSSINTRCKITVSQTGDIAEALIINEIMAANVDVYLDPSFNYGSWVELYNPTDMSISLGGLYITDDPLNLKKNRLINEYGILPAKGYALLNFDHHEIWKLASYRQIDDKLDCDGGVIIISDGTNIITQQEYPQSIARTSYARTTDGGTNWSMTGIPSPGTSNQANGGFAANQLEAPVIDKDAQVFGGTLQVSVNIPAGATLMYTTDGTTPTLSNGQTSSTGLFNVKNTTSYRFRLFRDGYLPSPVVTRTYIYKDKTYPFPIISIVTNEQNLYSKEYGVFEQGPNGRKGRGQTDIECNWNMGWDRPVSVEIISEENECIISQECDFSMCGGWSRAWTPHSFKLKAGKTYDFKDFFSAQLFDKKPYIKNKTLQIRNGGNNVLSYDDMGGRIRDAILQQIVARSGINIDYQEWQPVHVLINGKYYATLNMREPNNKHYAYANYGIDTDEMDQFEIEPDSGYVQMEGTDEAWLRLIELSKNAAEEESYTEIRQLLDIDAYINVMAAEFYLGGTDWPHNNVKGFRDINNGKFRFVLFDLDFAGQTSTPFQNFFGKENFQSEHELLGYDYSVNKSLEGTRRSGTNTFVTLFKNLLKNNQFRKQFIDTYCIFGGSVMLPKYVKEIAEEMKNYIQKGIYSEDYFDPSLSSNYVINKFTATWNSNLVDHMKKRSEMNISNIEKQAVTLSANIKGAKITVNGIDLPYAEFDGYLFAPISLTATAPVGYRFVGWKNTEKTSNEYISTNAEYTLPSSGKQHLSAVFEKISEENLIAEGITPIRINEVSAANSMYINDYFKKNDWIELYNTTQEDIDIAGMYISDNTEKPQKYQVPEDNAMLNTIIPANGYKIIWCDKLENIGEDIHTSFKLAAEGGDVLITTDSYADTLTYDMHIGTQTFGRYPDGANNTYAMNIPTIAKSNMLSSYDTLFIAPAEPEPDAIRPYIKEGGITIAYVDGAVNVKSEESPISSIGIYNTLGMPMPVNAIMRAGRQFASLNVTTLPKGVYVVKATTQMGDECHIKLSINSH